jgi:predicted amidophosphoribosyltransferase
VIELARAAGAFFLPSVCLACRGTATGGRGMPALLSGGVCEACWDSLPEPAPDRCPRCDEALAAAPAPELCGRCQVDPPAFDRLAAASPYIGSARAILRAFKFRGADYLGPRLAARMLERLPAPAVDEITAVPSTGRARRARGYHPAAALARTLSARLGVPFAPSRLIKVRDTEVQSRLPAARRRANVRGAFRVSGRPRQRVLLVDDVATSCATARECSRRLSEAGARSILVWCFARASRGDLPEGAA